VSTLLILGGGGFLARYITRHYERLGWRVVSVGRGGRVLHAWQLPHPELAPLLAVEQPAVCVNAAGMASVPASMVEPLADFESNTVLNYQVLDALRRRSPATVYIHLSSAAVYGDPRCLPVCEDDPLAPISPYGWHKRMSEQVLAEHSSVFGMRTASLRIFSAYGPGLHRQVVWDIASRAIAKPDQSLLLQGSAEDSRDFVHGADVAAAVQAVTEHGELGGECYNLAGGTETRIVDLAGLVMRLLGRSARIEFDERRRPGNPSRWHADITRLTALGFAPRIALGEGVKEVIDEVRKQPWLTNGTS
jgi:UDP-glucose 4-epimerase